jgi:mannosyl-oligosaccharide alpha-1,2-mannosidase
MPRFRRYRVFLFVALCTIAALYHFTTVREWEDATAASVQSLKKITYQDGGSPAAAGQDGKQTDGSPNGPPITNTASPDQNPALQPSFSSTTVPKEQEIAPSSLISPSQQDEKATTASAANLDADFLKKDTTVKQVGQGRKELTVPIPDKPPIHWKKTPDHFPIPPEKLIRLPTEKPLDIPKIQAVFKDESPVQKKAREVKLAKIKEAFQFSWDGYKTHAWMHDELTPTTGSYKDPFNGWAATLVDSLDTLWIMGMEDEFRQAMLAIREIDFTTSLRHDIPVFETTIRYLGGLLSAYDLTGGKQDILLRLAKELGDVLMGAFDTPNRMPLTYYYWMP